MIITQIKLISSDNKLRMEKKIHILIGFQTKIVTVGVSTAEVYQNILKIPIFQLKMTYH